MSNVQEVFGKFAVELADGAELFDTHEEASEALAKYTFAEKHTKLAEAYCESREISGKNKVGKCNVIIDFLLWANTQEATQEAPAREATQEAPVQEAPVQEAPARTQF